MSQEIIIWSIIAVIAALAIIIGAVEKVIISFRPHNAEHAHHLVEMAKEREMFYLPGDKLHPENEEDDDDFFEDL